MKTENYRFCETVTAGSRSRWHIRELSAIGAKYSGGADTPALCGRQVSWDIPCNITASQVEGCCKACREAFLDKANGSPD